MSRAPDHFDRARALWEDRHAGLAIERDRWRWAFFVTAALVAIAVVLAVWAAVMSRYQPFIVAVDDLGQVQPVLAPKTITDWPDEAVRHELASFLRDWRAVSVDAAVLRGRLKRLRYFLETNSAAQTKITTWEQAPDSNPFRVAELRTVDVEVASVNLVGGRTWIAEWTETFRDRTSGARQETRRYTGTFTIGQRQIRDERILLHNPMGMVIEDFDIRRVA